MDLPEPIEEERGATPSLLDLAKPVDDEPRSLLEYAKPLDRDPRPTSSYAGGLARQFLSALTLGFDEKLEGAATHALGGSYGETVEHRRRQKERFAEENPVASTLAHGAGTIGSFMLPVGWLARLGLAWRVAHALLSQSSVARMTAPATQAGSRLSRFTQSPFHHAGGRR